MAPYRTIAARPAEEARSRPPSDDEPVLSWLAIGLGALRVAIAVATGETWGAEASLAGILLFLGIAGLLHRRTTTIAARRRRVDDAPGTSDPARSRDAPTILVIEDEAALRRVLRTTLQGRGFRVIEATSIADGLRSMREEPDLVLLDLCLPDGDGVDFLRTRSRPDDVPVIAMSASGRDGDRVRLISEGAREFLAKPFASERLVESVRAVLSQASRSGSDTTYEVGPIRVDVGRREAMVSGHSVDLTPTEFRLLARLVRHAGQVQTNHTLLRELPGDEDRGVSTLRARMATLRRKIEADPVRPRWLMTEPGVGYRLRGDEP